VARMPPPFALGPYDVLPEIVLLVMRRIARWL
jgi:hypothetical protein